MTMPSYCRLVAAGAVLAVLAGCAVPGTRVPDAGATSGTSGFEGALARDYAALAAVEREQGDIRDATTYALRSRDAAQGNAPPPDDVALRQPFLRDAYVADLGSARERLVSALDGPAREHAAPALARAQASFDCWLEQATEDLQPEHIAACRNSFLAAMTDVEAARAPEVAAAPEPPPPAPDYPDKYLVFFDFDKAEITTEAMRVMQETRDDANQAPFSRVLATGHADRAGSDAYNLRLSERRADAVQSALSGLGIAAESIETAARGEADPLVPTEDGVREPQNRRVEIQIER